MKKILVIAGTMLFGFIGANATGTNYNIDINNNATLSYSVGGVSQTDEVSNTDTFKVDRKVDTTVATTDTTNKIVVPGDNIAPQDNNKPLTFTVTNNSNGAQSYILEVSNLATGTATLAGGGTDNIDFTGDVKVCTDATCTGGNIAGTEIAFTEDQTITYYVFADIPANTADDSRASIALTATAVDTGTTTPMTDDKGIADDAATVQVVFAEGAGDAAGDAQYDGKHSALSAYEVVTATVDASKTSCIIWDPVNLTTNPKRIPGAVVRYAVDVNNTGSADATSVSLSDGLQSDLSYGTSAPAPAAVARISTETCTCTNPGADNGDSISESGGTVTANYDTVAAGTHECAYFDVTIN